MQLFLPILSGMVKCVDPDQTASSREVIWVCTACLCHFVRNFGVCNFRTYTEKKNNTYSEEDSFKNVSISESLLLDKGNNCLTYYNK